MNLNNKELRVLIVDDVQQNIQVLGQILRQEKFLINIAQNGKQALDIVQKVRPDLILLDIMMPEMDGFETCKHLKANPETQNIPVIFLTARTEIDDIAQGFELGAVDYLTKPFHPTEMLARVRTHLQICKLQGDLRHQISENNRLRREQEAFLRHELNNYLTPIMGFANLLIEAGDLTERAYNWAENILEGTNLAISLTESLKQIQVLESNPGKLKKSRIALQEMIHHIIENLIVVFNHQVAVQFQSQPISLEADGVLLSGVFQNLIKNALEHVYDLEDSQRHISIELARDGQWASVSINNPGPTIPAEHLDTFFDKFNTRNKEKGSGLGTTYALLVVRAHGGKIDVASSKEEGTTLQVRLPALSL